MAPNLKFQFFWVNILEYRNFQTLDRNTWQAKFPIYFIFFKCQALFYDRNGILRKNYDELGWGSSSKMKLRHGFEMPLHHR